MGGDAVSGRTQAGRDKRRPRDKGMDPDGLVALMKELKTMQARRGPRRVAIDEPEAAPDSPQGSVGLDGDAGKAHLPAEAQNAPAVSPQTDAERRLRAAAHNKRLQATRRVVIDDGNGPAT